MLEIDLLGLGRMERKYLETLIRVFGGGPAGIEAIAYTMNVSADTLTDEVEPYLLRSELVVRSPRGRVVTARAYDHLRLRPAEPDATQRPLFG
jgi:Holliday junction DNA helicase RuvB